LYGIKQSSRCWFELFDQTLEEKGFQNSKVDRCLYILNRGSLKGNIYVLLYVDDVVIITYKYNAETMTNFKAFLMQQFRMIDLKQISLFVGTRVIRSENEITLDQTIFLKNILTKFNMSDCKPVATPLPVQMNY
jgi:hypothetical protein